MRHAARRDQNEAAIRAALSDAGVPYRVISCPALGDLEVICDGVPRLIEIKDGGKSYTRAQIARREWLAANGVNLEAYAPTWRSVADATTWLARKCL